MAYNTKFKIALQNDAGDYYSAVENYDNTWNVTTNPAESFIRYMPVGWPNLSITWERNMTYFGVFRSLTNTFEFVGDARAIMLYLLFGGGGVSAYCKMTVYIFNESTFGYDVFYTSEIDLTEASDDKRNERFTVATLDSRLYELLKAKADSSFNIPFWNYDSGTVEWSVNANAVFAYHDGIKSLWRVNLQGAETAADPVPYAPNGWNGGRHGTIPNDGYHTLPALGNYVIVQANGTTTFAGNDLLEPVMKTGTQLPITNEVNFTENSNITSSGNYIIRPLIDNVDLVFEIWGKIDGGIDFLGSAPQAPFYMQFVVFELNDNGEPSQTTPGQYDVFAVLKSFPLGSTSPYMPPDSGYFNTRTTLSLTRNKSYVLGIIATNDGNDLSGFTSSFSMADLRLSAYSNYNSGTASPVSAPVFPASTVIGFRPHRLLRALVKVIDSVETDAYGFPVETGVGYVGESEFLADPDVNPAINYDLIPFQCLETSENAIRNVVGYPYLTKSLSSFFRQWSGINMMGLGIIGDTKIKIEPLAYWFDRDTEILNLQNMVANLKVTPLTEIMGNRVSGGYAEPETNKNFGTDGFCFPVEWDLPLNKTPKQLDYRVTQAATDMYYIEKARVQNNSGNSSPSSSNGSILLQITADVVELPTISNPGGEDVVVSAYGLQKYPTAQSTDDTTAPYLKGFYYPDTAYNLGLDPSSNIRRNGPYLRTMCDGVGDFGGVMSFRKIYQQQYNDPSVPALTLPGMSKLLNVVIPISQVADIPLTALGSKIFRPYLFEFQSDYPVNMYTLINANPRGYISFTWKKIQYKGFIYSVEQQAGNNAATDFKLIAHPLTTNADLRAA